MKLQPAAEIKKVTISNFDKLKADALQSDFQKPYKRH